MQQQDQTPYWEPSSLSHFQCATEISIENSIFTSIAGNEGIQTSMTNNKRKKKDMY